MFKQTWLLVALLVGVSAAGPVLAHAKLESSVPAANTQVAVAPQNLVLNFDEEVHLAALRLSTGSMQVAVNLDTTGKATRNVTLALPTLMPGEYQVHWTALAADDGHVTKGSFAFTIAATH